MKLSTARILVAYITFITATQAVPIGSASTTALSVSHTLSYMVHN